MWVTIQKSADRGGINLIIIGANEGMFMIARSVAIAMCLLFISRPAFSKECWALTDMKGQVALSKEYTFIADKFSNVMVLCFDEKTGSVSGDDTQLMRFGASTLAGWATNKGIELFVVYQIDRANGKVFFTKTRIGTGTLIPGAPNIVGAFVGKAVRLR